MTYKNDPVGPPPTYCSVGLVARSGESGWYRVGGWQGMQPLVWIAGQLQMFNTNQPVEVVYDPTVWETAKGL